MRGKIRHKGAFVDRDGNVSVLCSKEPAPINLLRHFLITQGQKASHRRQSWTNRAEAVTCPRCLAAMALSVW